MGIAASGIAVMPASLQEWMLEAGRQCFVYATDAMIMALPDENNRKKF